MTLVNPYVFGAGGGGGGSAYYGTAEDLTGGSFSNTSYADKLSTSPTLVNGRTYLLMWTADVQFPATAVTMSAQLTINGAVQSEQAFPSTKTSAPTDRSQVGGFALHTAGGSAVPFAIQAKTSGGAPTISNLRISWLALDAAQDYTQESLTRQTTTSSTLQTAATLTFSDTGDYVVLVSFDIDGGSGTKKFEISDGTVSIGSTTIARGSIADPNRYPVVAMLDIGAVSGSKTVTVKYGSNGSQTVGISNVRMIAIRLNRYANSYKTTLGADNGGTDSTYVAALSQTFTPDATDHLTLAAWGMASSISGNHANYGRFNDDGTIANEMAAGTDTSTTTGRWLSGFGHRQATYTASSRTQSIDRHRDTTNTTYVEADAMILTLDLDGIS